MKMQSDTSKLSAEKTMRQLLAEKDEVSLCSLDGTILGRADKFEAHKYPSQLHLAISVWLFNTQSEVLLQQRSDKKIVGAGWWANSVCGNVWPTETFFECALRRLRVEMGITSGIELKPLYKFAYKAYGNKTYGEHELDQVYASVYQGKVEPNPSEVGAYKWVDFEELFLKVSTIEYIAAEQSLLLTDAELKEKTSPVELEVDGKKLSIAPWTIFMLKNPKLFDGFKQVIE